MNTPSSSMASFLAMLLLKRTLQAVVVTFAVGTLCFFLVMALPGDMAFRVAAGRYGYDLVSAEAAEAVRRELGLDRPWFIQLLNWWAALARFDLGISLLSGERVIDAISHQLGHSLTLAFRAVAISAILGPIIGIVAGFRPEGWFDRLTLVLAAVLRALPPFVVGLVLIIVVSVHLGITPAAGHGSEAHTVLPTLTLALALIAVSARVARDATVAVLASPYFAFAQTKGLSDTRAFLHHGLRNIAVPVVAYLAVQFTFLVEGMVIVETLFAWPGIGHALVHAVVGRDIPMIQGTALLTALVFVFLSACVDLASLALDPRRRDA